MNIALDQLLLATRNKGKLRELTDLLSNHGTRVLSLDQVPDAPADVEETGLTFADNAMLKALRYGAAAHMPTLADDSGLEVDALHGQPGVFSARFAGPHARDADNNALLLERLEHTPDPQRTARFRCVLALYLPDPDMADALAAHLPRHNQASALAPEALTIPGAPGHLPGAVFLVQGSVEGLILRQPRGDQGFGYDPLFFHPGMDQTFAQASAGKKGVSHRAVALRALMKLLGAA